MHNDSGRTVRLRGISVYRDASGKLLGANHVYLNSEQGYPSGASRGSLVETDWFPANRDESRTEVILTYLGG